jgi:hypothetical protein
VHRVSADPESAALSPEQVRERLVGHLRRHAIACRTLGSPIYAALMVHAADDLAADGPVAAVLAGHDEDPVPAALAMRLVGAVHRLALAGEAPALGRFYPSVAGDAVERFDAGRAWAAFRAVLVEHPAEIRAGLSMAPQTNEVGRAAALVGGLLHVRARFPLPVRLVEIGASAGLNLRADHMRVALYGGRGVGPPGSPVVLQEPWRGSMPPLGERLEIVERLGSDLDPVDVGTHEGRLRLTSFVWPDQRARLDRLRGAFALARAVPATLVAARAQATVEALSLVEGAATVVWHSVMWQYVDPTEQAAITARLEALGEAATPSAPLARLSLEPRGRGSAKGVEFVVRLRTWPGDGVRVLATAHPHGDTVVWRRLDG